MQTTTPKPPPLHLLAAFEAAARHLSFTKAAAERHRTQSAISRQVITLEQALGVRLFLREHRKLALTDDGRQLYASCSATLAQLHATVARLRAPAVRAVLSLTTSPAIASLWLIPRLSRFTRAHPDIDMRIDSTRSRRDLVGDGYDLALRAGRADARLGTPLGGESLQPVCSPELRRDKTRPLRVPQDLRRHTLLQAVTSPKTRLPEEWTPWLDAVGLPRLQPAATLTFSDYDEAVTAALNGQGIALGRRPLIDDLLRSRKLVAPFKQRVRSPRGYFLQFAPGVHARPAVRAFERWLIQELQRG